ncbi:MAG: Rrf2 family transcriptional regulator [Thermodesulfovibrio sp.]|uniref:Rrf2 family transcriptional regulator n=1 Tax=Thermodesulfovibrio obliviosus TaxID=3118332 RepID=A0AAU8H2F4_9BACT
MKKLEGPLAFIPCLNPKKGCLRIDVCVIHLIWEKLGERMKEFLNTITLKDIIELNHREVEMKA